MQRLKVGVLREARIFCKIIFCRDNDNSLCYSDIVGLEAAESGRQIQRYVRLTKLILTILEMVDNNQIAFSPAVELSYLTEKEQADLLITMESEEATPSLSQAQRMKRLSTDGKLDIDTIFSIITEEKPNQKEKIKLKKDNIKGFTT